MYLTNICFILLACVGSHFTIEGVQVFGGTQNKNPSWIHGGIAEADEDYNKHHVHVKPQHPSQQSPQYSTSEYPSEYTPYYPSQYTPPYPTPGRPQSPSQFKPPFTAPTKPQPSTSPAQQHHQPHHQQPHHPVHHHNQISNPPIKPPSAVGLPTPTFDQYNHRFPDGSYEFRYELPDETVRYERGYFIYFHHKKSIVVRGFYSYRLPGKGYLTVFYTADHYGYRQDSSGITPHRPQLPRSLGERRILQDEEAVGVVSSINENKLQ